MLLGTMDHPYRVCPRPRALHLRGSYDAPPERDLPFACSPIVPTSALRELLPDDSALGELLLDHSTLCADPAATWRTPSLASTLMPRGRRAPLSPPTSPPTPHRRFHGIPKVKSSSREVAVLACLQISRRVHLLGTFARAARGFMGRAKGVLVFGREAVAGFVPQLEDCSQQLGMEGKTHPGGQWEWIGATTSTTTYA
jgi:hypothetical protein